MRYLPLFFDIDAKKVIVVGGQAIAVAKLRTLLKTNANIHVFSSNPDSQILEWAAKKQISLHRRIVEKQDLVSALVC